MHKKGISSKVIKECKQKCEELGYFQKELVVSLSYASATNSQFLQTIGRKLKLDLAIDAIMTCLCLQCPLL